MLLALTKSLARLKYGKFRYNSPWTQVGLVGFVCFCSVGMSSAISNLGAGGLDNITLSNVANSVLYAVFAISGLFLAGAINNILGPRLTLCLGTSGYAIYVGSLWAFADHGTSAFVIVAGGIMGFTAGLLWAAQGAIMMGYPMEKDKGRSFSVFWTIFSMGAVLGAAIALGIEAHSTVGRASTTVYTVILVIMLTAMFTSWLILPPSLVVRGDGTVAEIEANLSMREELKNFTKLFLDWRIAILFPMFFTSNYFYAYQGSIIAHMFNARARALASLLTNLGAVVGAILIGFVLDMSPGNRRTRAICGWCTVLFLQLLVWSGGIAWQVQFKRTEPPMLMDWSGGNSPYAYLLLFGYYVADACYQGLAYYIMASLTNDSFRLARMAGFYKGIQSAGAAVSFGMEAALTPYLTEIIVSWAMVLFSLPFAFVVIWTIKDTNYEQEATHHVEDIDAKDISGVALPAGHHGRLDTAQDVEKDVKDEPSHVERA